MKLLLLCLGAIFHVEAGLVVIQPSPIGSLNIVSSGGSQIAFVDQGLGDVELVLTDPEGFQRSYLIDSELTPIINVLSPYQGIIDTTSYLNVLLQLENAVTTGEINLLILEAFRSLAQGKNSGIQSPALDVIRQGQVDVSSLVELGRVTPVVYKQILIVGQNQKNRYMSSPYVQDFVPLVYKQILVIGGKSKAERSKRDDVEDISPWFMKV